MRIPQFENPINSVNDLVDQNGTIFIKDYLFDEYRRYYLLQNTSEWNHVANTLVKASWGCENETKLCIETNGTYEFMVKYYLHGNKTHAFIKASLNELDFEIMPEKNWWRSEKVLTAKWNPYFSVQTKRNWIKWETFRKTKCNYWKMDQP